MPPQSKRPRVVIYFGDTGGGHRAAAEAVAEALHEQYGTRLSTQLVDFFSKAGVRALSQAPSLYPRMVRAGVYGASYRATDRRSTARVITGSLWPYLRQIARRMVRAHPADLVVATYPLFNAALLRAMGRSRPPFYIVVTDFATIHALWFDKRADRIFVPAEAARQRGIELGMQAERLRVVGLPVKRGYSKPSESREALRRRLGWPMHKPVVLLVGGGEGMGPVASIAQSIDLCGLDIAQAIVTGRNKRLQAKLKQTSWENPTFIYGFTSQMPEMMHAADVLLTKAGGATIAEALNAHVPMILYSRIPGQEEGNVSYVVDAGAGVYAPDETLVIRALTRWIARPHERERAVANARKVARPEAAALIAAAIGRGLHLSARPARASQREQTRPQRARRVPAG